MKLVAAGLSLTSLLVACDRRHDDASPPPRSSAPSAPSAAPVAVTNTASSAPSLVDAATASSASPPCSRLTKVALADLKGLTEEAASGPARRVDDSTIDHHRTTIEEVALGPFLVRYAMSAPAPVGEWLEIREAGCAGPALRDSPYWNGGPLGLRRRGDTFVITWRPGGNRDDVALVAFRRER